MRLFILTSILAISGCSHMANDQWSGQDKAQHFIASAMLAAAGNEYAQHQGNSRDRSAAIGLMFSVSLARQKNCGTAVPQGAAGAGRTSPGMLQARLPAMRSGNWHITRGADLSPSHAASAILKTRQLPAR